MIENRETQMRPRAQAVLICLCIFILMSDVLLPMIPLTDRREFLTLHRVLCFSLLSLVLARLPKNSGRTGALLLAVYWVWLMIARLLVGGLSDALPNEITRAGALCAVFYLTRSLDARGRSRLSAWFCGVFSPLWRPCPSWASWCPSILSPKSASVTSTFPLPWSPRAPASSAP